MDARYNQRDDSGNTDKRVIFPRGISPVGALIHTTAGTSSLDWLAGRSARVGAPASADYLIDRDGTRHKITPKGWAAYHAGKSRAVIQGRLWRDDAISALLVGIELECLNDEECTFQQIDSLSELIVHLSIDFSWRWPYTLLGHYEVARPLGRRSDPQGFPWGNFMGTLFLRSWHEQVPGLREEQLLYDIEKGE